ncbi:MAG: hypothetical protein V1900_03470 [Candidatus Aenigmatarchaeota archaeon]
MRADFGKTFSMAFRYAFNIERLLPFFIINIVLVGFALLFVDSAINILPLMMTNGFAIGSIVSSFLVVAAVFIIAALLNIFLRTVITDNAKLYWQKKKSRIAKSVPVAKKRYLTIVIALILVSLISGFASSVLVPIPFLGRAFSVIASLVLTMIFLFVMQIIIISNKGAIDGIREGYRLFVKSPLEIFLFLIVFAILSFVILFVAIIPVLAVLLPIAIQSAALFMNPNAAVFASIVSMVKANMFSFAVAGTISSAIFAYLYVFQESAKTFFYMQKKSR